MADHASLAAWDDFNARTRRAALEQLAATTGRLIAGPSDGNVNMHFHSFFSYNADGWSPSHIAWASRQAGLYAAALCDFDVLDGLEEFLGAGELLGLRAAINLETRNFVPEYAAMEMTSPGEPGVTYSMGGGFAAVPAPGTPQAETLASFRRSARQRNLELVARINPHLPDVAIDYEGDVVPLTPADNATERHIIRAYLNKSYAVFETDDHVAAYWAEVLGKPAADVAAMLGTPAIEEAIRSKLAKRGGLGYVQPSRDTFPPIDDFIHWVLSCRAIPLVTWLDGTSEGEADGRAMVECLTAKGCAGMNIVPDRNWNLKNPEERALKIGKLTEIVGIADALGLPINIGTEMNKAGLPFVDDLSGEVLRRFKGSFIRGAQVMVGQTVLLRHAGVSYVDCDMPLAKRNEFFAAVGALPPLTDEVVRRLREAGERKALAAVEAAVTKGTW